MTSGLAPSGLERLADAAALEAATTRLAAAISADHPEGATLVGVLKGSVIFLADLARRITVPVLVDLIAISPYDGTSDRTRVVKDLDQPVAGRAVVLVSSIVDTGLTADFLRRHLEAAAPASIRLAALADKRARRILPITPDYTAFTVPDRFLIGYGLDYRGRYRNLPDLWAVDGASLRDQPDRHVADLYGTDPRSDDRAWPSGSATDPLSTRRR